MKETLGSRCTTRYQMIQISSGIVVKSREKRIEEERNYLGKKEQCNRTDTADIYEKKKKKKIPIGTAIQFRFLPVAPNLRNSAATIPLLGCEKFD